MSVAFRRESDEEHLEPKFEIPIPPGPNLVTAAGLALIDARVEALEALLAAGGDEPEVAALKRDLRYWQTRQITAEVQTAPDGQTVQIGTAVTFRLGGKRQTLSIVGADEADPAKKLISFAAPISRALLGSEVGDVLDYGDREEAIEVLAIFAENGRKSTSFES